MFLLARQGKISRRGGAKNTHFSRCSYQLHFDLVKQCLIRALAEVAYAQTKATSMSESNQNLSVSPPHAKQPKPHPSLCSIKPILRMFRISIGSNAKANNKKLLICYLFKHQAQTKAQRVNNLSNADDQRRHDSVGRSVQANCFASQALDAGP